MGVTPLDVAEATGNMESKQAMLSQVWSRTASVVCVGLDYCGSRSYCLLSLSLTLYVLLTCLSSAQHTWLYMWRTCCLSEVDKGSLLLQDFPVLVSFVPWTFINSRRNCVWQEYRICFTARALII